MYAYILIEFIYNINVNHIMISCFKVKPLDNKSFLINDFIVIQKDTKNSQTICRYN